MASIVSSHELGHRGTAGVGQVQAVSDHAAGSRIRDGVPIRDAHVRVLRRLLAQHVVVGLVVRPGLVDGEPHHVGHAVECLHHGVDPSCVARRVAAVVRAELDDDDVVDLGTPGGGDLRPGDGRAVDGCVEGEIPVPELLSRIAAFEPSITESPSRKTARAGAAPAASVRKGGGQRRRDRRARTRQGAAEVHGAWTAILVHRGVVHPKSPPLTWPVSAAATSGRTFTRYHTDTVSPIQLNRIPMPHAATHTTRLRPARANAHSGRLCRVEQRPHRQRQRDREDDDPDDRRRGRPLL